MISRYPAYKDSGIEWVGEMPEGWQSKPLFAVFKERQVSNDGNRESNVLSLSYGHIIRRDIESNFGLLPESFETYNVVEPSNIVLRLTDLQNDKRSLRCGLVNEKGIITSAYLTLEKKAEIDPKYMYYLLHNYDIWKVFYSMGGGVRQAIKFDDLKRLPILIPSLNEQEFIASYLDHKATLVDSLIAKKERMINLLREECAATISQAVTVGLNPRVEMKNSDMEWLGNIPKHWLLKKIKYIARINTQALSETTDDDYEFHYVDIGNVDLEDGFILGEKIKFINAPSRARRIVVEGDTIVSTVRTYLKAIAYFEDNVRDVIVSTGFAVIHPLEIIHPRYLYYVLRSEIFINRVCAISVGVSYPATNSSDLASLLVWFPPDWKEQEGIVEYLDQIVAKTKTTIYMLQREIELLKEYRTSLISEVVTGKIDVRSEGDLKHGG